MQTELLDRPLVFVDIETTGGSPMTSRVLEVAAVRIEGNRETGRFSQLLDPGQDIPWFISQLTGIKNEDTWGKPNFAHVISDGSHFLELLEGAVFVAHNVMFDYRFLQQEFRIAGKKLRMPTACTVLLSRHFYPRERTHKLDVLIGRHNLSVSDRHRALGDALALVDFYSILRETFGVQRVRDAIEAQYVRAPRRRV